MRRRWLVAVGVAGVTVLATVAALLIWALATEGDPAYTSLRQAKAQEIPGTLGYVLEPPPGDFDPALTPARALRLGADQYVEREDLRMTLASVRNTLSGGPSLGTAWVIVNRNVCFRSAKGEVVSDARGKDPNDLGCTDSNLWVVAVEADGGELLMSESAFDPTGTWAPVTGS